MNHFVDAAGNERSAGASSSSRKGKKSNSNKPKQPQRGPGVAQLEKIRLLNQAGFHPTNLHPQDDNVANWVIEYFSFLKVVSTCQFIYCLSFLQIGMGQLERSNMIYGQSQPNSDPRWNANNAMFEVEHYAQPGIITRHLFQVQVEDSHRKETMSNSMGSSSCIISDSNGSQELDLELRLSL
ncbi:hypothetical protein SSX86_026127 [Deinandra increscens subsp. villosa]|uniref:Uncharacterized protein n=1 Tax=Deinandra increscens subsp. villosa TaxID=3103831 RepID=A0AAP0GNP0_9ASTR